MKILIIEDEQQLLSSIQQSLEKETFLVETAIDYHTALEKALVYEYDCILLDIMLPKGSGLDILKILKREGKSDNVIIISAKDSLDDKLAGLELGADDYLTKPFHLAELNARIKAVLRRKDLNGTNILQIANAKLDFDSRQFWVNEVMVSLNRKEFDVLYYFMINKDRLVTKSALAEHVWGDHSDNADNFDFVYYQIKNLRKKIHSTTADIEIESIYGIGYKLVAL
ncbi:response regulator transcription factor [Zunongwangia endophytica]|uniref:Response regulator transcription factor n=1 Tax=Zunongwangia endophytica TaxID=1808945 RepID=A0ABV8H4E8_9FLAO|nr:response regulator transcription factor [Zunongwangia endophytica]MDN3595574.1 response regulator transcription factor [Zunongwangia endophytica]